jgi:ParB family chromosome partitioning protein
VSGERIQDIPVDLIDAEAQVRERFDKESMDELSEQIKRHGLLQPILVRRVGQRYAIVFGGRRFLAAKMAGLPTVRARIIEKELEPGDIALWQLIENCHENLTPIEWAKGIAAAMSGKKMTGRQIATELGKSDASISNSLALLTLPKWIQELVEDGSIAASAASRLARVEDTDRQAELARRLAEGKLTRDGLLGVAEAKDGKSEQENGKSRRVTAALGPGRTVTVSGQGLDLESFIKTLEELITKARRVRTRGIGLATFVKILGEEAKRNRETSDVGVSAK